MKKMNIRVHVAVFVLSMAVLAVMFVEAYGQSLSVGGDVATKVAVQLSDCPTVTSGYRICPVVPATGQPFLALSVAGFNSGAPFQVASQGPPGANGATGPAGASVTGPTGPQGPPGLVQSFGSFKCPLGGSGSSGVNGGPGCTESTP